MDTNIRFGAPECTRCGQRHPISYDCEAAEKAANASMIDAIEKAARDKPNYVGAPAIFALEQACESLWAAFGGFGVYLVGSALDRADWRDVDVRLIMGDEEFAALFPDAGQHWEHDPRWLLLTVAISERLSKITGLPIDFQFQPQTHANARFPGKRHAIGMRIVTSE